MIIKAIQFWLFLYIAGFISTIVYSQVKLPKLICDGMVLQREADVKIWGWAANREKVSLRFIDSTYSTTTDDSGKWEVKLSKLHAGGPYTMTINAYNTIVINDILIGDVWVCSGQSNMELNMKRARPIYEDEIATSENGNIRCFMVPQTYNFKETQKDYASGKWVPANPLTILDFPAVPYFFAKELNAKYQVPIGLISTSVGGSPGEAWMSEEALKAFPVYYKEAQRFKDESLIHRIEKEDNERIRNWNNTLRQNDEGYKNHEKIWNDPFLNTSDWSTMKIPGYWIDAGLGPINGVVWFKKEVTVSASMIGKKALLNLGRIVDADSVFVNGTLVGTTGYQYPPRRYDIPSDLLKEGKNTIVVRVISNIGNGGFVLDKPYELKCGSQTIDLKGDWQYKLGAVMEPLASQTFVRWKPTGLFNAMLSPIFNFGIKGVIWYQGESNADRPIEYRTLFPALIADWRTQWNQGDFPFLFVQLANYMEAKSQPSESNWAMLRESQLQTLSVPNTAMVVIIDIGEWNDIHPLNKKDVGKRLALAADKVAYQNKVTISSGPIYQSMKIDGNKVFLSFSDIGSGLIAKGSSELNYFAIAGTDKKFVWAQAKIDNDKVVVWSNQVPNPVAVRYAWADNPEGANFYNREGLPASPFRTDDWMDK